MDFKFHACAMSIERPPAIDRSCSSARGSRVRSRVEDFLSSSLKSTAGFGKHARVVLAR